MALTAYFLSLQVSIALVGATVIGAAVMLTVASTFMILSCFRQLEKKILEKEYHKQHLQAPGKCKALENNNNKGLSPKEQFVSDITLDNNLSQPAITSHNSYSTLTGFNLHIPRGQM